MIEFKFPRLNHNQIGYYVGLTLGAFSCARFFSSTYFGYYSDIYGRKRFLLLSLFVNFIATAIFGNMPIIELLIIVRFLQGLLSSTNTLAKTVLVDIARNNRISNDHRSLLFAYLGSAFALSRSVSSSLGGLAVGVAKALGFQDPYQFACYGAASLVFLALIMSTFLPETNEKAQSLDTRSIIEIDPVDAPQKGFLRGMKAMLAQPVTMKLLINYGLTAFSNACCFVLWVLSAQSKEIQFGFNFNSTEIGLFFGLYGICAFLFQLLCFKRVLKAIGIYRTYSYGCIVQMFQCSLLPIIMILNYYIRSYAFLWIMLFLFSLISGVGFMTQMPVAQSMIVNVSDPQLQGLVQGSSESLATLLRGFGPIVTGIIYSYCMYHFGNSFFMYFLLFMQYAVTFLIFITLKSEDVSGTSNNS
jgi:MFS family permease